MDEYSPRAPAIPSPTGAVCRESPLGGSLSEDAASLKPAESDRIPLCPSDFGQQRSFVDGDPRLGRG